MKAYHFTADTLSDGSPIPAIGETLRHEGDIVMCRSGLHASRHVFDALGYAPGHLLHRVIIVGDIVRHADKIVGRERTITATLDATDVLQKFARMCALDVIHLWDAPDIVEQYLRTGDKSLRDAARAAAWAAAGAEAGAEAWDEAWDAARAAAWAEAWDAARTQRGAQRGTQRGPQRGPKRGTQRGPKRGAQRGAQRGRQRHPNSGIDSLAW